MTKKELEEENRRLRAALASPEYFWNGDPFGALDEKEYIVDISKPPYQSTIGPDGTRYLMYKHVKLTGIR